MNPCRTSRTCAALLAALLCGCYPVSRPGPHAPATVAPPPAALRNLGNPYEIDPARSLLVVLVFPDGRLSGFGHPHVIASHELTGTIYLPEDPRQASARMSFPVGTLTVDEPQLRAAQGGEFATDVPPPARAGTRRNMLGPALLDAAHYPQIELTAGGDCPARQLSPAAAVCVTATVRGTPYLLAVPLQARRDGDELTVSGETALRQSELGLAPFSALLGALAVRDEMRLQLRLVARRAVSADPTPPAARRPCTPCAGPRS